jgi:hypothetical protein
MLRIASKHSIDTLLVDAQLRECLTHNLVLDCARETGDGAKAKIIRSNLNAFTAGPTEEQDQSTDERGDKANVPSTHDTS